ncbi:MAG: AmmeMemoRadiSam system protein B [Myxococcales bacterium]|nr:AmmeMemoRadiSam system protein B [Myxococcales bacterium]
MTRVVLLGPSHHVYLQGVAGAGVEAFDSTFGPFEVDGAPETHGALESPRPGARAREHALEVQLPFLATVFSHSGDPYQEADRPTLVPLLVCDAEPEVVSRAVQELCGGDETIFVISSDLSHFHDDEEAKRRDARTAARIVALDDTPLTGSDACGAAAINGLLALARARWPSRPALFTTSRAACSSPEWTRPTSISRASPRTSTTGSARDICNPSSIRSCTWPKRPRSGSRSPRCSSPARTTTRPCSRPSARGCTSTWARTCRCTSRRSTQTTACWTCTGRPPARCAAARKRSLNATVIRSCLMPSTRPDAASTAVSPCPVASTGRSGTSDEGGSVCTSYEGRRTIPNQKLTMDRMAARKFSSSTGLAT